MAAANVSREQYQETASPRYTYRFGAFHLDPHQRLLTRAGRTVVLPAKVFDTLVALVESNGAPVDNRVLMERIWPGAKVEESLLRFHVAQVRMALGDEERLIEGVAPVAYRFLADLERLEGEPPPPPQPIALARPARPAANLGFGKLWWGAAALAIASLAFVVIRSFDWSDGEAAQHPLRSMTVASFQAAPADQPMAAAITSGLVPRLQSIPGLSVRQGQGTQGAEAVLTGSLERSGNKVITKVRLQPVAPGAAEIFTETFDIPASQLFSIEPIVAKRVAIALRARLGPAQEANLLRLPTQNSEAYRLFTQVPWGRGSEKQRIAALEKVVETDPEFATAHAALAEACRAAAVSPVQVLPELLRKAKAAAEKAVELDATLADPNVAIGYANLYLDWNLAAAEKSAKRAIELAPGSGAAHALQALVLMAQSKFDAALQEWKKTPQDNEDTRYGVALTHYYARRYDKAIEEFRPALLKAQPPAWAAQAFGHSLLAKGQERDAINEYMRADAIAGVPNRPALRKAYDKEGLEGYWQKKIGMRGQLGPYETAVALVQTGKSWKAFKPLEQALETRSPELIFLHIDPAMDPIRKDERFQNMVRKVGIAR